MLTNIFHALSRIAIFENLGWVEEVDAIADGWVENVDYTIVDNVIYQYNEPDLISQYNFTEDNLEPGRKLFLRLLSNWERATQWVWSTNIDNAISGGEYTEISLGK